MKRLLIVGLCLLVISIFPVVNGCDKERIVESTEYIHDIEYVESPADTVYLVDTVFTSDSLYSVDTVLVHDTVFQVDHIYDTVTVYQTVYDTTFLTDTVTTGEGGPNEYLAITALEYYCDDLVFAAINAELGYTDGWVFYLSAFQLGLTERSSTVYDLYGYIDYWKGDWSDFAAFEFYWRLTYTGGDPSNPENWQMTEPPAPAAGHHPGINMVESQPQAQSVRR